MKSSKVIFAILGLVLACIGIGCGIMAVGLFAANNEYHDPGMGQIGLLFGIGAFFALVCAIGLFVKASDWSGKDGFASSVAYILGGALVLVGFGGIVIYADEWKNYNYAIHLRGYYILIVASVIAILCGFLLVRKAFRDKKAIRTRISKR